MQEIREIRHEIDRECKGDAEAFYKWIVASQQKLGRRLVRRQPKFGAGQECPAYQVVE